MTGLLLDDVYPVARVAHRCSACNRVIDPGEKYHRQRVIGDDGPYVWKECGHCDRVSMNVWTRDPDANWYRDDGLDLMYYLSDNFPDIYELFRTGWQGVALDDIPLPFPSGVAS